MYEAAREEMVVILYNTNNTIRAEYSSHVSEFGANRCRQASPLMAI